MAKIEFWLEYASTYSYLSVARIGQLAEEYGVQIDWQLFWLFPVREEQGLPMPFPEGSARARYMWLDLERRARQLHLPYRRPEIYPFKDGLKQQTTRALQRGIFGAPSFLVNGELFWGDDRLEAVLDCARSPARG